MDQCVCIMYEAIGVARIRNRSYWQSWCVCCCWQQVCCFDFSRLSMCAPVGSSIQMDDQSLKRLINFNAGFWEGDYDRLDRDTIRVGELLAFVEICFRRHWHGSKQASCDWSLHWWRIVKRFRIASHRCYDTQQTVNTSFFNMPPENTEFKTRQTRQTETHHVQRVWVSETIVSILSPIWRNFWTKKSWTTLWMIGTTFHIIGARK